VTTALSREAAGYGRWQSDDAYGSAPEPVVYAFGAVSRKQPFGQTVALAAVGGLETIRLLNLVRKSGRSAGVRFGHAFEVFAVDHDQWPSLD
jgi:hypothetical protein